MCHGCEIILFGSDEGTAEIASELAVKHIPDVAVNEHGTPLVNDLFEKAQRIASYDILTYVNADIILMSDFIQAVRDVAHASDKFLMVGRRWDLDIQELWDFDRPEWESGLRNVIRERGELRSQAAIDYFVFSRGLLDAIPPFAIGRTAWDNWLIFRARQHSSLVVDATDCVMAVHQNHDYGDYGSAKALWNGEEAHQNLKLMGKGFRNLDDVTHLLRPDGLHSAWTAAELLRHPRRLASRYPALRGPMGIGGSCLRFLRRVRPAQESAETSRRTGNL